MTRSAIYCRVSTDAQESEGTSLQTQLENCLKYCKDKDYQIIYQYQETYSGLTVDRPKLTELRESIRNGYLDVIVIYSLDRWTRNPNQGVILQDELEKQKVKLESVTETIEDTELGKLISYIRGFACKLEAEKIKERTMRGKKAHARAGDIQHGGFSSTLGYDYTPRIDKQHPHRELLTRQRPK